MFEMLNFIYLCLEMLLGRQSCYISNNIATMKKSFIFIFILNYVYVINLHTFIHFVWNKMVQNYDSVFNLLYIYIGLDIEGIYRVSGVKSKVEALKQLFNEGMLSFKFQHAHSTNFYMLTLQSFYKSVIYDVLKQNFLILQPRQDIFQQSSTLNLNIFSQLLGLEKKYGIQYFLLKSLFLYLFFRTKDRPYRL